MSYDAKHRRPVLQGPRCKWDGGPRSTADISWIVWHTTEGGGYPRQPSALAVARWGAAWVPADHKVSWHLVVDDSVAIVTLPDDVISYTAFSRANRHGLHIELAGHARWSTLEWYRHQATLKRAAWRAALWCRRYDIPPRFLTDDEYRRGDKGMITHAQVTRVDRVGSHTDPGPRFPARRVARMVRRRLETLAGARE